MRDPVVAQDGHTYERAAIEEWFRSCQDVELTSPMTGMPLASRILFSNHALRKTIEDYLKQNPSDSVNMTTPSEISSMVSLHNQRPDSPLLIDFRTDEEIARDDAAKQKSVKTTYVISPPNDFVLGCGHLHHSQVDSIAVINGLSEVSRTHVDAKAESLVCCATLTTRQGGKYVACGSSNGYLEMHELINNKLMSITLEDEVSAAHGDSIHSIASWNSPDYPVFVTGSRDRLIKVWKASSTSPSWRKRAPNLVKERAFQGSDVSYVKHKQNTSINKSESKCRRFSSFRKSSFSSDSLQPLKPDSSDPKVATIDNEEYAWSFDCQTVFSDSNDFINCLDIEASSGNLLAVGEDWQARVYDLTHESLLEVYENHSYNVRCCSWASSGERIISGGGGNRSSVFATGGDDELVVVCDTRSRGKIAQLKCGAAVACCCWGPEGGSELSWLAAGGGIPSDSFMGSTDCVGGWIRIWDPRMWKAVGDCCSRTSQQRKDYKVADGDTDKRRDAHASVVNYIYPMRGQQGKTMLASCGGDSAVRFWSLPTGPGGIAAPVLVDTYENDDNVSNVFISIL